MTKNELRELAQIIVNSLNEPQPHITDGVLLHMYISDGVPIISEKKSGFHCGCFGYCSCDGNHSKKKLKIADFIEHKPVSAYFL